MNRCALCDDQVAVVTLEIDFRPGDRVALASPLAICAICRQLLEGDQDSRLARRLSADYDDLGPDRIVDHLRARVRSIQPIGPEPDELGKLRLAGFEPLDDHTGLVEEVSAAWPEPHRVRVDTRQEAGGDDEPLWLVRSPWPALTVADVMRIIWPWVEREPFGQTDIEPRIAEVFTWSDGFALSRLGADPHPR